MTREWNQSNFKRKIQPRCYSDSNTADTPHSPWSCAPVRSANSSGMCGSLKKEGEEGDCESAVIVNVIITLIGGCGRIKSSRLHSCIFPAAKYLIVGITFISYCMVGDVSTSLMRLTTNIIPARSNLLCFISSLSFSVRRIFFLPLCVPA